MTFVIIQYFSVNFNVIDLLNHLATAEKEKTIRKHTQSSAHYNEAHYKHNVAYHVVRLYKLCLTPERFLIFLIVCTDTVNPVKKTFT